MSEPLTSDVDQPQAKPRGLRLLASRKVQMAIATVLVALAAEYGLNVGEEMILGIIALGASLILGIAHEDAGRWSASTAPGGKTDAPTKSR